jgi:hypothetical protein
MNPADQLAKHSSQISRLEQVMTALAEAQVKTQRQFQADLNTRKN